MISKKTAEKIKLIVETCCTDSFLKKRILTNRLNQLAKTPTGAKLIESFRINENTPKIHISDEITIPSKSNPQILLSETYSSDLTGVLALSDALCLQIQKDSELTPTPTDGSLSAVLAHRLNAADLVMNRCALSYELQNGKPTDPFGRFYQEQYAKSAQTKNDQERRAQTNARVFTAFWTADLSAAKDPASIELILRWNTTSARQSLLAAQPQNSEDTPKHPVTDTNPRAVIEAYCARLNNPALTPEQLVESPKSNIRFTLDSADPAHNTFHLYRDETPVTTAKIDKDQPNGAYITSGCFTKFYGVLETLTADGLPVHKQTVTPASIEESSYQNGVKTSERKAKLNTDGISEELNIVYKNGKKSSSVKNRYKEGIPTFEEQYTYTADGNPLLKQFTEYAVSDGRHIGRIVADFSEKDQEKPAKLRWQIYEKGKIIDVSAGEYSIFQIQHQLDPAKNRFKKQQIKPAKSPLSVLLDTCSITRSTEQPDQPAEDIRSKPQKSK